MRSTKRDKDLTKARHIAMYFMKKCTQIPLLEIANFLHRKDHTTVIHALEKTEHSKIIKSKFQSITYQNRS